MRVFFFFKQKTAYEMRISDWSSDVCSSDLKVDLKQISFLALVEQYLTFIAEARELKLEVAADYLVMAAWLAYLKSALLLPKDPLEDPSPDELALRLQLRLQRLAALRDAAARQLPRARRGSSEDRRVGQERFSRCRSRMALVP